MTRAALARPPHCAGSLDSATLLPSLYRTEQNFGWSAGMAAITAGLLAQTALPPGPVAEVGCGGGRLLAGLGPLLPGRAVAAIDLHPEALRRAASILAGRAQLAQAHLHCLPWPDDALALVLALDTLDQRGVRLSHALHECRRVLCTGGVLLLRVSAHPWLQGPHDDAFNTGRRYTKHTIRRALERAGFAPLRVTFANSLLGLPIAALRLLQRWRVLPWLPSLYTTPGLNALLAATLQVEARWLRHYDLPAGLSLYVLARKTADEQPSPPRTHREEFDEPSDEPGV